MMMYFLCCPYCCKKYELAHLHERNLGNFYTQCDVCGNLWRYYIPDGESDKPEYQNKSPQDTENLVGIIIGRIMIAIFIIYGIMLITEFQSCARETRQTATELKKETDKLNTELEKFQLECEKSLRELEQIQRRQYPYR